VFVFSVKSAFSAVNQSPSFALFAFVQFFSSPIVQIREIGVKNSAFFENRGQFRLWFRLRRAEASRVGR